MRAKWEVRLLRKSEATQDRSSGSPIVANTVCVMTGACEDAVISKSAPGEEILCSEVKPSGFMEERLREDRPSTPGANNGGGNHVRLLRFLRKT